MGRDEKKKKSSITQKGKRAVKEKDRGREDIVRCALDSPSVIFW